MPTPRFGWMLIGAALLIGGCASDSDSLNAPPGDSDPDLDLAAEAAETEGEDGEEEDAACQAGKVTVTLPDYPYGENPLTEISPDYLQRLARDYVCQGEATGGVPDGVDFLLRYAPLRLFNDLLTQGPADWKKALWVLHLSGYFGGIWLKTNLTKFNPPDGDGEESPHSMEPSEDGGLVKAAEMAQEAVEAAEGEEADLFAFNRSSLLTFIIPKFGIASNFGYNKGYLLQIYDNPPEGLTPPSGFIRCEGILWCDYARIHILALPGLQVVSEALAGETEPYASLGVKVKKSQEGAVSMGRQVWGSFLDYSGMPQDFYEDLLLISSTFLESVEAAGLLSAQAVAEKKADSGRNGAYLQSGLIIWLSAYMGSFTSSPPPDAPLPTLTVEE